MRKTIIATVLAVLALVGVTGAAAQPDGTAVKPNGVTIVNGDSLASAATPTGAVAYAASR